MRSDLPHACRRSPPPTPSTQRLPPQRMRKRSNQNSSDRQRGARRKSTPSACPFLDRTRFDSNKSVLFVEIARSANGHRTRGYSNGITSSAKPIVAGRAEQGIGRVTVARTLRRDEGPTFKLADEVRSRGGMHVNCTELHERRRIRPQLYGRCDAKATEVLPTNTSHSTTTSWKGGLRRPEKSENQSPRSSHTAAPTVSHVIYSATQSTTETHFATAWSSCTTKRTQENAARNTRSRPLLTTGLICPPRERAAKQRSSFDCLASTAEF